jgi:hypothetical protein
MKITRILCVYLLFIFSVSAIFAQTDEEKAKKELESNTLKMIDEVVSESTTLKLWENRSLVQALAGDLIWNSDQKRAKKLFIAAADELRQANFEVKKADSNQLAAGSINLSPRYAIIKIIAKHDAESAYETMISTRTVEVQNALNKRNNQTLTEVFMMNDEFYLEQFITKKLAEDNPEKAVKLLREQLSKSNISSELLEILKKIAVKDEELAEKLTTEVMDALTSADYAKNRRNIYNALRFMDSVREFNEKNAAQTLAKSIPLKISKESQNAVGEKILNSLLATKDWMDDHLVSNTLTYFDRLFPDKVARLEQKLIELRSLAPKGVESSNPREFEKLSPIDAIKSAAKFKHPMMKYGIYINVARKMLKTGQGEKAKELLLQYGIPSVQRDKVIALIDEALAGKTLDEGKLNEAELLILQLKSNSRKVKRLVELAIKTNQINTAKSREAALKLMQTARGFVNEIPEDKDDADDILNLVSGYSNIEPALAFPFLDPLIEQTDDVLNAQAKVDKMKKRNGLFKNDEILFIRSLGFGDSSLASYGKSLTLLAQADFTKTKSLAEQFKRNDIRILTKLFIAQSILGEKVGFSGRGSFSIVADDGESGEFGVEN